jgi:hypothetical protein
MTLTILYRHPERPDEGGMVMIAEQAKAAAMVDQLEKRGFVVEKITARSSGGAFSPVDPS